MINKKEISIYRRVIILNCFFKIYETVIKMQLVPFLESQFSPFLGTCRESHNTQHILIKLLKEWRKKPSQQLSGRRCFYASFKNVLLHASWFINCETCSIRFLRNCLNEICSLSLFFCVIILSCFNFCVHIIVEEKLFTLLFAGNFVLTLIWVGSLGVRFEVRDGGEGKITPCLKLETWNLVPKYTQIRSFRRYTF